MDELAEKFSSRIELMEHLTDFFEEVSDFDKVIDVYLEWMKQVDATDENDINIKFAVLFCKLILAFMMGAAHEGQMSAAEFTRLYNRLKDE